MLYIVPNIVSNIVYDIGLDVIKLMMLLVQDCVCVVGITCCPLSIQDQTVGRFDPIGDLDVTGGGDIWYARPLLFFTCTVCPTGHMGDTTFHKNVSLVFFNTFEPF